MTDPVFLKTEIIGNIAFHIWSNKTHWSYEDEYQFAFKTLEPFSMLQCLKLVHEQVTNQTDFVDVSQNDVGCPLHVYYKDIRDYLELLLEKINI